MVGCQFRGAGTQSISDFEVPRSVRCCGGESWVCWSCHIRLCGSCS